MLGSGIQEPNGGVARYHHSDTLRNARVSTEITGYAVSTFVFLHERTRNPEYLDAAIRAGQFLVGTAWSPSLKTFPFEHSRDGDAPQPLTYFFDCGIIVRGLLSLWRATGSEEYLAIAILAGRSMARDFAAREADGTNTWHPILDLPGKYPLQWGSQWSRQPGCYQLKSALAWHELADATGDSQFARSYEAAVAKALATQESFLPAETPEKTMDRLHAYCYFLEGLQPAYSRADVRPVLANGISRVSRYLREIRSEFERSDVDAQLLRIRLMAFRSAGLPLNQEEATEEAAAIAEFQHESESADNGGFWFGRKAGSMMPFLNPVSTAFCLQAYEWWQDHQSGRSGAQAII